MKRVKLRRKGKIAYYRLKQYIVHLLEEGFRGVEELLYRQLWREQFLKYQKRIVRPKLRENYLLNYSRRLYFH